ncbi:hypothetical protein [Streptomyces sp. GbtcB6]|uniref:hypothetical protein n=1 Tax=Streptomyces sp. GbtcB6 TaxID=2824751 RepID=UPI001C30E99A|nr:hypothetical protein [Streptomyces sp. GbtcB6]
MRVPNPGDLARRHSPAAVPAPPRAVPEPAAQPAPAPEAPDSGAGADVAERPTPPRPMYEPRELTAEEAMAPGVLTDTEYFRSVFRHCLIRSSLPPHARLVLHDLLHRANHRSGRLGSSAQPDAAQIALATGLTELQVQITLTVLHTSGWLAYRPHTGSGRHLYDLVIPALELERARGRRFLAQQE